MSNVALVDNAKTQYTGCSVRVTVNMAMTKLATVFGSTSAVQPVPKTTVAETKQVGVDQDFDLTAFALSRGPVRSGGEGRKAFDLELADGSRDEASGKVQTMWLAVFASEAEAEALLEVADSCIKQQNPMSFFNVKGCRAAGEEAFKFTSAFKGFFIIVAGSPHALEMRTRAPELYNLEDKAPVPQTLWTPYETFSAQKATLTTIRSLKDMGTSPATGIEDIDMQNTLWQLNWVQVLEPSQGTPLRTQDGARLWFPVVPRDFLESMTDYMTERND